MERLENIISKVVNIIKVACDYQGGGDPPSVQLGDPHLHFVTSQPAPWPGVNRPTAGKVWTTTPLKETASHVDNDGYYM